MACLGIACCVEKRKRNNKQKKHYFKCLPVHVISFVVSATLWQKVKRAQEHKTKKGNSFVEVNLYPGTVCDYIPQTWNGLYERAFEGIEKQSSKGLKRWELFWQDLSRHLSNTMVKIILLLSSWRECCNLERKQCTTDIKDKCQTMNWTHIVSVTLLTKKCMWCLYEFTNRPYEYETIWYHKTFFKGVN